MAELLEVMAAALASGLCGYQIARHIERARSRAVRQALRDLVNAADSSPFTSIAHVVEHTVPESRRLAGIGKVAEDE